MNRGLDRRSGKAACACRTKSGNVCRAIPAWKCSTCNGIVCGIHIVRRRGAAHCPRCAARSLQFTHRGAERRVPVAAIAARVQPAVRFEEG